MTCAEVCKRKLHAITAYVKVLLLFNFLGRGLVRISRVNANCRHVQIDKNVHWIQTM